MGALQTHPSYFPCIPTDKGIGNNFSETIPI